MTLPGLILKLPQLDWYFDFPFAELGLEIKRCYLSDLQFEGCHIAGNGWVHEFAECIVPIEEGFSSIGVPAWHHFSIDQPRNDPDWYLVGDSTNGWHGAAFTGRSLHDVTATGPYNASYRLDFNDGRQHYFDGSGRIVARSHRRSTAAILFEYDDTIQGAGRLDKVIDAAGRELLISETYIGDLSGVPQFEIDSITLPSGATINYDQDIDGFLTNVDYPSREAVVAAPWGGSGPGGSSHPSFQSSTVTPAVSYIYGSTAQKLTEVYNGNGNASLKVSYEGDPSLGFNPKDGLTQLPAEEGQVSQIQEGASNAGIWTFGRFAAGATFPFAPYTQHNHVCVFNPNGFLTSYMLNVDDQVVQVEEHLYNFVNPLAESRSTAFDSSWTWMYEWESCSCGLLSAIVEPDGNRHEYEYDTNSNLTLHRLTSNNGSSENLEWKWTYDSESRPTYHEAPEDAASQGWTITYVADVAPNDGGEIKTLSHPKLGGGTTDWVFVYDEQGRPIRSEGPDHGAPNTGFWEEFTYWPENQGLPGDPGDDANLLRRHYTRRDKTVWSEFGFDANGIVDYTETSNGAVFNLTIDDGGYVQKWEGPVRGVQRYTVEFDYDAEGRRVNARARYYDTSPDGPADPVDQAAFETVETTYFYDDSDNVTRVEWDVAEDLRAVTTYGYDALGDLIQVVDPDGVVTYVIRDERGLPWQIGDALQDATSVFYRVIDYTPDGQISLVEDADTLNFGGDPAVIGDHDKSYRRNRYDHLDRVATVESLDTPGIVPELARSGYTYYSGSTLPATVYTSVLDSGTSTLETMEETEFVYGDWHDHPLQVIHRVYGQSGGGTPVRTSTATYQYYPSGLIQNIRILPAAVPSEPHPDGTLLAQFTYEDWGALESVSDHHGNALEFEYGAGTGYLERHTIKQFDPVTATTQSFERKFINDVAGRKIGVEYLDSLGAPQRTESYEYDSFDQLVARVDSDGVRWEADYRLDGALLTERRGVVGGAATTTRTSTYSVGGRIESAVDGSGNRVVQWQYDGQGRPIKEIQPDGTSWDYTFHKSGFLESITLPSGRYFWFGYNDRGFVGERRVFETKPALGVDPSTATPDRRDTYQWGPMGQLVQAVKDADGTPDVMEFMYEADGTLKMELIGGAGGTEVIYDRDDRGRISAIRVPSSGYEAHYDYDDRDRVTQLADNANFANPIAEIAYLGPGHVIRRQVLGDGSVQNVDRNDFGEVIDLQTHFGLAAGGLLQDLTGQMPDLQHSLFRDDLGQIEAILRPHDGLSGEGDAFRYDELNRLTEAVHGSDDPLGELALPNSSVFDAAVAYALDGDQHRQAVTVTPFGSAAETTTYTTALDRHHYTAVTDHYGTTEIRAFDLNGNVDQIGSRTFEYDEDNLLIGVNGSTGPVATYDYDALGRRTRKTVGGVTTRYVYAGAWILEEWVSLYGGPEQLQVSHYHTFGADGVAMSRRRDHADLDGDSSTTDYVDLYLHRDHLGSVQELTLGSSGAIIESYRYDPYGTPTVVQSGPSSQGFSPHWNSFLFTGREYDFETGLYHFRARTYDPTVGAFLQEDPIGYADGLNPVAYVAGNPISLTDPWGTSAIGDAFEDLSDVIDRNRDLIGAAAATIADILSPLAGIIDAISAAIGKDVGGWISGGFRGEMRDLGWWARAKKGAGAALGVAGGAVAALTKFKKIRKRLKDLFDDLRKPAPAQCFVAGTLVLMASGDLVPIEEVQVGDRVADTGLRLMEEEVPPGEYLAVSGDVVAGVGVGTWLETLVPSEAAAEEELIGSRFLIELSSNEVRGFVEVDATRQVTITEGEGCVVQTKTRRVANELVRVVFEGGEEIVGTPEHPFLLAGERERAAEPGAWLRMGELDAGDEVASVEQSSEIEAVHWLDCSGQSVWNLEVDGSSSYLVESRGLVAHNSHVATGGVPGAGAPSPRFSPEKQALVDMAKMDKKKGMTAGDMEAYKELNETLPDPFPRSKVRGPEAHPGRGHGSKPHGHVGPVNHIPITDVD